VNRCGHGAASGLVTGRVAGRGLDLRDVAWRLLFPGSPLAWMLIRGSVVREYPYPSGDVSTRGVLGVARKASVTTGVCVAISPEIAGLDRLR